MPGERKQEAKPNTHGQQIAYFLSMLGKARRGFASLRGKAEARSRMAPSSAQVTWRRQGPWPRDLDTAAWGFQASPRHCLAVEFGVTHCSDVTSD